VPFCLECASYDCIGQAWMARSEVDPRWLVGILRDNMNNKSCASELYRFCTESVILMLLITFATL
jgi:hypothetical protein